MSSKGKSHNLVEHMVALRGSERAMPAGAKLIGPVEPNHPMEVTVCIRRKTALPSADKLGAQLPRERKLMARGNEFAAVYGGAPESMAAAKSFLEKSMLRLTREDLEGQRMKAAGPASAMEKAFGVKLMRYRAADGDEYVGRVGKIHLPAQLEKEVTGIFGLDNRPQANHHHRIHPMPTGTSHTSNARPWFVPSELARVYGFPQADGDGQCIGILEFGGGFDKNDLAAYFNQIGIPMPQVIAVGVDGASHQSGVDPEADGEVMLDIEVAGALAPKARLAVYFSKFTEQGWVDAITEAVHDNTNRPSVISISWGFAEGFSIWTQQAIDRVNETLNEAALLGVTICVASGDDGSSDGVEDGHAHVDFPSSSPYVLAVGGTTLKANGSHPEEVVWNDGPRATAGGATGGGISDVMAVPQWQAGVVPPSVNPGHSQGRGVPDVAADADPETGFFVRANGRNGIAGGTSASAPLWAALIARANQLVGRSVGYINPLLYQACRQSDICRDITSGNNDTHRMVGGYEAGRGWDPCTGWGSPDGAKFLATLNPK